jgi:hypothetical protein
VLGYVLSQAVKLEAVETAAKLPTKLLVVMSTAPKEHDQQQPSTAGLRPMRWLLPNVDIYRTTWHHIEEDVNLDTLYRENLYIT